MKFLSAIIHLSPLAAAIWPIPSAYTHGEGVLWINSNVKITYISPSAVSIVNTNPLYTLTDLEAEAFHI